MSLVGDGGGEEELCHVPSGGCSVTHVPNGGALVGDGGGEEDLVEERRICVMYAVGDTDSHMSLVGDGGGEEELCHVRSEGTHAQSLTYVPSGGWGRENVPSGGRGRRRGALPCTQLSDTCP